MAADRINPPSDIHDKGARTAEKSVVVNRPVEEVYAYWEDLTRLPEFMHHLESVESIGGGKTRWTANAMWGHKVHWDAEITEKEPGRLIQWESLPGAEVASQGRVEFHTVEDDDSGEKGTRLDVVVHYRPAGGKVVTTIAKWYEETVSDKLEEDLHRFKLMLESRAGKPA